MWNMKFIIVPVIIGANEVVTKVLKKHLEAIPGKKFNTFTRKDSCT
jgi:hypothetical protein